MPVNSVAENVFGTLGTVCWTVQLIPQIWKSYRDKDTTGLSDWMILTWGVSGAFLGTYAVVQDLNIPLILQPQLFGFFAIISWGQCQYYTRHRKLRSTICLSVLILAVLGGFEAGMIFALRPSYNRGESSGKAGVQFFGIISSVMIALALLPQYYEIYKHKEVIGISVAFMVVDMLGGVFSDLSLVFKPSFDVIAGVTYSLVVVMDLAVILSAAILNPRANRRRRRLQELEGLEDVIGESTRTNTAGTTRVSTPIVSPSPTSTAHEQSRVFTTIQSPREVENVDNVEKIEEDEKFY